MTDRVQIRSLDQLVNNQEAGGYTLPTDLLDAHRTYRRVSQLTPPQQPAVSPETVAAELVTAAGEGQPVDVVAYAHRLAEADAERAAVERSRVVLLAANEQALDAAVSVAASLTEHTITTHLRPAFDTVLKEVRGIAATLSGHALDAHSLLSAPNKVRQAYLRLPELAARYSAIQNARRLVNTLGYQAPQHDASGLFSTFRRPLAFHPGWQPTSPVPALPFPSDPVERLLWLVGPEASAAEPWLPTVAEQDAAWWGQFGEAIERRKNYTGAANAFGKALV